MTLELSSRNIATQELRRFFAWEHLPPHLQEVSKACHLLALQMCEALPRVAARGRPALAKARDSRELTVGLRKLLEAKDAFVRARLP